MVNIVTGHRQLASCIVVKFGVYHSTLVVRQLSLSTGWCFTSTNEYFP